MLLPFTALMTLCIALMSAHSTQAVFESTYIRYPNETSVWYWGYRHNVSWDNTQFIIGATNPSVNLYKGDSDTGYVLAQGFNLTDGHVEVTVPSVEADSDYVIRLFYVPRPHSATASSTALSTSSNTVVPSHTSSIPSSPATTVSGTTTAAPANNTPAATDTTSTPATTATTAPSSRAATSSEYLRGNSFTILQSPSPSTATPPATSTKSASTTPGTVDAQDVPPQGQ